MSKRVLVAMSGGMDSAVAAALLKTQGYDVVGLHIQFWDKTRMTERRPGGSCVAMTDPDVVEKLCEQLEIPFHLVNVRELYQHEIVDLFIHEAIQARRPNPCVRCNSRVKFAALLQKADDLRCDMVATGHYAKIVRNNDNTETNVYRATDRARDQTYFLFELTQEQLTRTLTPLGDLLEANVHRMAHTFGLPIAAKPDRLQTCFVDDQSFATMIEQSCPERYRPAGPIVDKDGRSLGRHNGLYRHYISEKNVISSANAEEAAMVVLGFDVKLNAVIVGPEKELFKKGLVATNCNWIGVLDFSRGIKAKTRMWVNQQENVDCTITLLGNNSVLVDFKKPQPLVLPGQAIVFYQEEIMIGGGWIEASTDPATTKLTKRQAFMSNPS